ncbi:hypothetical protein QEH52_01615 [Coraliomargarita sp. SDUM461003]|uniref:Ribbon-helix-helix protein CopG domain-containing protein n=1 Tax=Thalassobacterium maritimum TaxID=3041265 RepID=A0ABU1APU4_9BACT|nr:hypothetical protein [Coraliomargarita sp. SDUM461003]MDQ8206189.1 hypothetical protein [Coraliomargarita sp. SDUM461003]
MTQEKSKSKSVSLLPSLWEKVEAKAAQQYGTNRSTYIRELIEKDLEAEPQNNEQHYQSPLDSECFEDLLLDFCDASTRRDAAEALKYIDLDQTAFVTHILKQATAALSKVREGDNWEDIRMIAPHLEAYEKDFYRAAAEEQTPYKQKPRAPIAE